MLTRRRGVWAGGFIVYALFWVWYTPWGGPLSQAEIDRHFDGIIQQARASGNEELLEANRDRMEGMRRFLESDDGGSFVMVNLMHEVDGAVELVDGSVAPNADAALRPYNAYMLPRLFSRASHPVLVGSGAASAFTLGEMSGASEWDSVALVRYRSRRDFLAITGTMSFRQSFQFKASAIDRTIAQPITARIALFDLRFSVALVMALLVLALDRVWGSRPNR
ncbi:MAG: hypothetical protein AAFZ11_14745 [Pseudomonadota bacterium]